MNSLYWVLAGLILYLIAVQAIKYTDSMPSFIQTGKIGLLLTIHTQRGKQLIERLSRYKFWNPWGTLGTVVATVVMILSFFVVVQAALVAILEETETGQITEPQNVLLIPGVNDFIPLSIAPEIVFGVLVGLLVHEGGHAIYCRTENIEIKSMGVIFMSFIPLGAFVEPDEESEKEASDLGRMRMFSAGVMNNFVISIILFALLFGPLIGSIAVVDGVHVGGSITPEEGIVPGDVIVGIDNDEIETESDYYSATRSNTNENVTIYRGNGEPIEKQRNVITTSTIQTGQFNLSPNTDIQFVNEEPVSTQAELYNELRRENTTSTITDNNGNNYTGVAGVYARGVNSNGELSEKGVPEDTSVIVTHLDDERVVHETEYMNKVVELNETEDVNITLYYDGKHHNYTVSHEETRLQGIQSGFSGINVDDMGVDFYPSQYFLDQFGGDNSIFQKLYFSIVAPLISAIGVGVNYNFFGFTGSMTNFYTTTGLLSIFGDTFAFVLFNLSFWTAWINIQLGIFNCLPAYPLDGGRNLEVQTAKIAETIGLEEHAETIGKSIAYVMTLIIAVLIIAIIFS